MNQDKYSKMTIDELVKIRGSFHDFSEQHQRATAELYKRQEQRDLSSASEAKAIALRASRIATISMIITTILSVTAIAISIIVNLPFLLNK